MAPAVELLIFDCDGVLVDSEMLSAGVLMGMLSDCGFPITPEIFRSDFLGRSYAAAAARAEDRFGRKLPADFQSGYRKRLFATLAAELRPMDGVLELLPRLRCAYCLATSSSPERLAVTLAATGLERFFAGRCFTAAEVERGKPAPDIFLYAASRMGAAPGRAVALEDSEMGLRAALAAGMAAWQFTGGAHALAGYRVPADVAPHRVVGSMRELGLALQELGLC
jgi:HAD superfamily hydrolase (TIGR01509 family)